MLPSDSEWFVRAYPWHISFLFSTSTQQAGSLCRSKSMWGHNCWHVFVLLKLCVFVPQTWTASHSPNFFTQFQLFPVCESAVRVLRRSCCFFFPFFSPRKALRQMDNENYWPRALSFWIPQLSRPPTWQLCPAVFRRWGIREKWNIKSLRWRSGAARPTQVKN